MRGFVTFMPTVALCGLVLSASTAVPAQPRHDTVGHVRPADTAGGAVREPKDIKVPGLLGSGKVRELNRAAEADRGLTRLALAFASAPESADLDTLMRGVLWRWTKASRHKPASRGAAMADARWLYFVEAFEGKPYRREQGPRRGSPKPTPQDAALICARADKLAEFHYAQMMLSTHLADLNDRMKVTWRPDVNAFSFDFSEVASTLADYTQAHPSEGLLKIARYARALAGLNLLDENAIAQLESGLKPLGPEVTAIVTAPRERLVRVCAANALHGLVEASRFGSAGSGIGGSRSV